MDFNDLKRLNEDTSEPIVTFPDTGTPPVDKDFNMFDDSAKYLTAAQDSVRDVCSKDLDFDRGNIISVMDDPPQFPSKSSSEELGLSFKNQRIAAGLISQV